MSRWEGMPKALGHPAHLYTTNDTSPIRGNNRMRTIVLIHSRSAMWSAIGGPYLVIETDKGPSHSALVIELHQYDQHGIVQLPGEISDFLNGEEKGG